MPEIYKIIIVCSLCGLGGFIDAIAGGGGLITLPAYLLIGLPAQLAAGSNKFSACLGSTVAIIRFGHSGKIRWREALTGMVCSWGGASIGASIAMWLPEHTLKWIIVAALPLAGSYIIFHGVPQEEEIALKPPVWNHRQALTVAAIGFGFGLYDGIIGPGTGTFIIIASVAFMHFDLVTASGNAKVLNWASNIASVVVYLCHGSINFKYAVPAALVTMLCGYLGACFCIRFGNKGIRKMLVVVLCLLFFKLLYDLLGQGI